jgi:hypothetical protein
MCVVSSSTELALCINQLRIYNFKLEAKFLTQINIQIELPYFEGKVTIYHDHKSLISPKKLLFVTEHFLMNCHYTKLCRW